MEKMKNKTKIIIDCDPGIDDAFAIILLVRSSLFKILAITTVAGNGTILNTFSNAQYILNYLKAEIPLYPGAPKPLFRNLVTANVQGQNAFGDVVVPKYERLAGNAVLRIKEIVSRNPGEVTVLSIGPLTNIANLISKYPQSTSLIKELVIMGGAIKVKGNKSKFAEFNFYVDPEAAQIVLRSDIKKVLIPLDVCNKVLIDISEFKNLKSPLIKSLAKSYLAGLSAYDSINKIIPYDPFAAYYLINTSAFKTRCLRFDVSTIGKRSGKVEILKGKSNTKVAFDINVARFTNDFFKILQGGDLNWLSEN